MGIYILDSLATFRGEYDLNMIKCSFPVCPVKPVGGFEHHEIATGSGVKPTVVAKSHIFWCEWHKDDLQKHVEHPGTWLTVEDLDRL